MTRRLNKKIKTSKQKSRKLDRVSRLNRKKRALVHNAKKYVYNLANVPLSDEQYIVLGKGLKFIPVPKKYNIGRSILADFNEFARKLRCRYQFRDKDNSIIHPFRQKSFYQPIPACSEIENYLDHTRYELSELEYHKNFYNLTKEQQTELRSLQNMHNVIFSKSDKGGAIIISNKDQYINEGLRQLNSIHYKEVNKPNLTDIKRVLLKRVNGMFDNGEIDRTTLDFLSGPPNKEPKLGRLFLLPKIHKLSEDVIQGIKNQSIIVNELPISRPIISQCNCVSERVSQFIDYFLLPLVKRQNSYIRDSGDFINKIEALKPDGNCLLVSFDCTSMYTNMEFDELIQSVQRAYNNVSQNDYSINIPSCETIVSLVSFVLKNNYFEFNDRYFVQTIGASMGSKCSPELCDIRAFEVINEIINSYAQSHKIRFYGRYRDDGFMIFHSSVQEVVDFFELANAHHPLLKFTYDISETEMIFLDTVVYKGHRFRDNGILDIKHYTKPTNTFQYLHRSSMHNPTVFSGFVKGEAIRLHRNNSSIINLNNDIYKFKLHLKERGYYDQEIDLNCRAATNMERSELLRFEPIINRQIPLVFVTKFHFSLKRINKALRKHYKKLIGNDTCKKLFPKPPMIAYSRHRNLKEILNRSFRI